MGRRRLVQLVAAAGLLGPVLATSDPSWAAGQSRFGEGRRDDASIEAVANETTTDTDTAARPGGSSAGPRLVCTWWGMGGLEATGVGRPIPTSELSDGLPYVLTCVDERGQEVVNEIRVWAAPVAAPAGPALGDLAVEARDRITIPAPVPASSPASETLVGVDTWLWVDGPWEPVTAEASAGAVTVTVTARPLSVRWEMGDGEIVTCAGPGSRYDTGRPGDEQSTTCSHTYRRSSEHLSGQAYQVTTTTVWDVSWAASGVAGGGSLGSLTRSASFPLRVAEAQALITREG